MATKTTNDGNSDLVGFMTVILFQVTDSPIEDIDSFRISAYGPRKLASICVADYRA